MIKLAPLLLLSLFSSLLLFRSKPSMPTRPLVFTHVTVIDATGKPAQPDMTVVMTGERITALGRTGRIKIPQGAEVVDASGKFLIPGLCDMHIHLTITPEQAVSREVILPMLVAYGVTSVRDMGGDWQRLQQLRQEIASGKLIGPRIIAPGPFVDGPQPPSASVRPVSNEAEARQAVRALQAQGVDFIKVQSGLTLDPYLAVMAEAKRLSIPVEGHVPEAVSAMEVVRAGQRSIEHISPVLPGDAGLVLGCSSRESELRAELAELNRAARQPNADRQPLRTRQRALQAQFFSTYNTEKAATLFALMIKNQTWAVPTLIWSKTFAPLSSNDLPADWPLNSIPPALRDRWQTRRDAVVKASTPEDFAFRKMLFEKSREFVGELHRAHVPLLAGTDALDAYVLPGFSLHQELELLVAAGLTPIEALQTATRNPAQFLGALSSRGTIETGQLADLVLLTANPLSDIRHTRRIAGVVLGGKYLTEATLRER
jgi:imidazolonepropionase-like amidohydrolase